VPGFLVKAASGFLSGKIVHKSAAFSKIIILLPKPSSPIDHYLEMKSGTSGPLAFLPTCRSRCTVREMVRKNEK